MTKTKKAVALPKVIKTTTPKTVPVKTIGSTKMPALSAGSKMMPTVKAAPNFKPTNPIKLKKGKAMTQAQDDAYDRKHGIKEGSKADTKADVKRGIKDKNFIKAAIKKPGALHQELGIKKGNKIPAATLAAAAKKGGKEGQRARFAETLKNMHKGYSAKAKKYAKSVGLKRQMP